jgi:haloalkane dehalogenase
LSSDAAVGCPEVRSPSCSSNAEPGAILTGGMREFCRSWPDRTEVSVNGIHFVQEDSPKEIAEAIAAWPAAVPLRNT